MNFEDKMSQALKGIIHIDALTRDKIVKVLASVVSDEIKRNVAQVELSAGGKIANLQGEIKALQGVVDRERRAHLRGW